MRKSLCAATGLVLVALLATSVRAGDEDVASKVIIPDFPYCPCDPEGAFYLEPTATFKGNNTYCFKIVVSPPPGCTSDCCTKADLKKIEIDANPECKIGGQVLRATINGAPSQTAPLVDRSFSGPPDTFVLKLTNIGLTMETANGAEICYYLGTNNGGKGCTSLEKMCRPPAGSPPGTCTAALFDSKNDCCPISDVGPKPPPPVPKPCKTCAYFNLLPPTVNPIPIPITEDVALGFAELVNDGIWSFSVMYGATITQNFTLVAYDNTFIKVCGEFASDADGAKLQPYVDEGLQLWLAEILDGDVCPEYLAGYSVVITVGGDGPIPTAPPPGCVNGTIAQQCIPKNVSFPKCVCNTKRFITPFAVNPAVYVDDAIATPYPDFTAYCFDIAVIKPDMSPENKCKDQATLNKVEFWANDKIRRRITKIYVEPAGGKGRYLEPSWGAVGEDTLKVTGLQWSMSQAIGGRICLLIRNDTPLADFCMGNEGSFYETCWLNLFNPAKNCCPLYTSTLLG